MSFIFYIYFHDFRIKKNIFPPLLKRKEVGEFSYYRYDSPEKNKA